MEWQITFRTKATIFFEKKFKKLFKFEIKNVSYWYFSGQIFIRMVFQVVPKGTSKPQTQSQTGLGLSQISVVWRFERLGQLHWIIWFSGLDTRDDSIQWGNHDTFHQYDTFLRTFDDFFFWLTGRLQNKKIENLKLISIHCTSQWELNWI